MMFCAGVCVKCIHFSFEKRGLNYVLAVGEVCNDT